MFVLDQVPPLPDVAFKVSALIGDPRASAQDISDLLKQDQGMTARILKLANSSYYAIPGGVKDVGKALTYLGFNTVAQLVLGLAVFGVFKERDSAHFSMKRFWRHSLGVAVASEMLAKESSKLRPEEAFTAGLLHDVGKLALCEVNPQELERIAALAAEDKASMAETEKKLSVTGHAEIGALLAERWGMPKLLRTAIRYHHDDVSQAVTLEPVDKCMVQTVSLANALCVFNNVGHSGNYSRSEVSEALLTPLGFTLARLGELTEKLNREMDRAGALANAWS